MYYEESETLLNDMDKFFDKLTDLTAEAPQNGVADLLEKGVYGVLIAAGSLSGFFCKGSSGATVGGASCLTLGKVITGNKKEAILNDVAEMWRNPQEILFATVADLVLGIASVSWKTLEVAMDDPINRDKILRIAKEVFESVACLNLKKNQLDE